eukprot:CAMPEP_0117014178 /NCGR_PEP_ID=MMETSP0472-20121206/11551_1 /TAXON_ID=693140 ORGANISM="Tiarina fusus, Strain LIS" /NCGR_SAMPLE_ID=MMETSP0472 /ASSEMBLY_ACC=CAM_ASM_000603 /LENGTH=125 /DNA_ID=CAMNT_0004717673 /DNA_START=79 /DNA_END=456 /DNA_ORIENTATION=+
MAATSSSPSPVIVCSTEQEYHDAIKDAGEKLVVVDCYADWCGPCRFMAPIFEAMALQYTNVVFIKVDVDKAPRIKNELGVWALPTFCFLKRGKKVGSVMGANEKNLRRGLENDGSVGVCSSCCIQ